MKLSFSSSWFFLVLATPFVVVVAKKEKKTKKTKNKNKNGSKSASSSSSSVDLLSDSMVDGSVRGDNKCVAATGSFDDKKEGNNRQKGGDGPFQTCYQVMNPTRDQYCWSKSYYDGGFCGWLECRPHNYDS